MSWEGFATPASLPGDAATLRGNTMHNLGRAQRSASYRPFMLLMAVVMGLVALTTGNSRAQTSAATSNEPMALKTLTLSGFINNSSGVFLDSQAIEYNRSKNSLSTERNYIQLDLNDNPTEHDQVFLRFWGVYEPSYPYEVGCSNEFGATVHCNSDFYNQYGIREFWIKHRLGPLDIFIGRQIVKWGESITFRATDQINPQDISWSFGFANLEQTYMPVWMIHPILNLPKFGPFDSNFLEVVYEPGFDFMYTNVDYANNQYDGLDAIAGRETLLTQIPGGRFAGRTDTRGCTTGARGTVCTGEGPPPPGRPAELAPPLVLFQRNGPNGTGLYVPSFKSPNQVFPNATFANSNVFVRLHTLAWDTEMTAIYANAHVYTPVIQLTNQTSPVVPGAVYDRRSNFIYPEYQGAGFTANRPLYLPGFMSGLPLVARTEVMYQNHMPYSTLAIPGTALYPSLIGGSPDAVTYTDQVLWIAAVDLDSAYVPWLTSSGTLTANAEVDGTTLLSPSKNMLQFPLFFSRMYHNDISGSINIATSWYWGSIAPAWTMTYDPNGETFAFFPSVTLTPPWTNKYFMTMRWIEILGTNRFGFPNGGSDLGIFKGLSQLVFQFQYNFELL